MMCGSLIQYFFSIYVVYNCCTAYATAGKPVLLHCLLQYKCATQQLLNKVTTACTIKIAS